jgi:hypothetical protein
MRDKEKALALVSVAVCLVLLPSAILGHHGTNISYDRSATVTVTGVVTDFRYINPHPPIFIDVTDEEGNVTNWTIETAPTPYTLALRGWNKRRSEEALKPGTVVTVTMAPARAGTPVGLLRSIVNEDGLAIFGDDIDSISVGRDQNEQ